LTGGKRSHSARTSSRKGGDRSWKPCWCISCCSDGTAVTAAALFAFSVRPGLSEKARNCRMPKAGSSIFWLRCRRWKKPDPILNSPSMKKSAGAA